MKRSKQREQAFLLIFSDMFKKDDESDNLIELYRESFEEVSDFAKQLYEGVKNNTDELDGFISEYLNGWKLNRISKVNLAVLRLAVYEIKYVDDVPVSVAINEAVELSKKYSGKEDASFVNGILGSFARSLD